MNRKLALLLAALAAAVGAPGVAQAQTGGDDDNYAVAVNTKDGSDLFRFAFSLRKVLGEVVDNENAAVAYASCTECRTTAIAVQIVFVVGSPETVTPVNLAVAYNDGCTLCQTFATAFQFVVGIEDETGGLTGRGQKELREVLKELRSLKKDDYTLEEFHRRTQALAARIREILRTEVVPSRKAGGRGADEEDPGDEEESEERPAPPAPPGGTATTGGGGSAEPPPTTTTGTTTTGTTGTGTTGTTTTQPTQTASPATTQTEPATTQTTP